ncbi:hypothetical protein IWZ01DRAFT_567413 [Phyllosticta capitalensis]
MSPSPGEMTKNIQPSAAPSAPLATSSRPATAQGLFGKLPAELKLNVLSHVDYPSALFLASTNHYWRSWIDPVSITSTTDKRFFLWRALGFEQHKFWGHVPCHGCFRIRKKRDFSARWHEQLQYLDAMEPYHRGTPSQLCLECERPVVVSSHHPQARVVKMGDRKKWFCVPCTKAFQVYQSTCTQHLFAYYGCQQCGSCMRGGKYLDICPVCADNSRRTANGLFVLHGTLGNIAFTATQATTAGVPAGWWEEFHLDSQSDLNLPYPGLPAGPRHPPMVLRNRPDSLSWWRRPASHSVAFGLDASVD